MQQNEEPENLTNQQLNNRLMSKMSVFHQKPNKGLLKIAVVVAEKGCRHEVVFKYRLRNICNMDRTCGAANDSHLCMYLANQKMCYFHWIETGKKTHDTILKKKL